MQNTVVLEASILGRKLFSGSVKLRIYTYIYIYEYRSQNRFEIRDAE